jgi:hypothetical protein
MTGSRLCTFLPPDATLLAHWQQFERDAFEHVHLSLACTLVTMYKKYLKKYAFARSLLLFHVSAVVFKLDVWTLTAPL